MPFPTEIKNLKPGDRFYFANDPEQTIWKKTKEHRTSGKKKFIFCETVTGNEIENVQDFAEDRNIMALYDKSDKPRQQEPPATAPAPIPTAQPKQIKPAPPLVPSFKKHLDTMVDKNHVASPTVKIYESRDYARFRRRNGNRDLNKTKIKKIIEEIKSGNNMLPYYPIQVEESADGFLDIDDGQHRQEISRILKEPVYYILVQETKSMSDIAKVNSLVEKWKPQDYMKCYIDAGNEHYKQLHAFWDTYRFSVGICLNLLDNGTPGKINGEQLDLKIQFEHGTFEVKEHAKAIAFADLCAQFEFFAHWRSREFAIALYRINQANKVPMQQIVEAISKNSNMLTQQAHYKDYVVCFEKILNLRTHHRVVIL